jgi:hypothetical protein
VVLNTFTPEQLARLGRSGTTDDEAESAPIKLDTNVMTEPGKTISGEDLYGQHDGPRPLPGLLNHGGEYRPAAAP